ncbi:MAG TPA: glycosyltransferase [Candidatus Borkfalkia stercoripullorum]|nr:glycosyltransferase [Candidatus Borkfalkia stercoripullorum]
MDLTLKIFDIALKVIVVMMCYRYLYLIVGFFGKAKVFPDAKKEHTYAVVICARNEEKVIGNLLDSIAAQRYPKDKLRVFVIADNCTDATAAIAREKGATVYERHDPAHARKGWALEFGFNKIREEFGIDFVEGYMIFDADNLLRPDFVKEMNKAFDEGKLDVITGYRNTKNFDTNGISAAYGIHFYRSSLNWHRARQIFHTSTHLAGTGYVIRSKWLEGGWKWFCLTEDTQFTYEVISRGGRIGYCEAAEFFDEQPTGFGTVLKQRLRWIKGRLYAFFAYGYKLIAGLFRKGTNKWACYDMFFYGFPYGLGAALLAIASFLVGFIGTAVGAGWSGILQEYLTLGMLKSIGIAALGFWLLNTVTALLVVIRERKKIHCSKPKLALYIVLFFWFDLIGSPLAIVSLFMRVTWKKIKHDDPTKIGDLVADTSASGEADDTVPLSEEKTDVPAAGGEGGEDGEGGAR